MVDSKFSFDNSGDKAIVVPGFNGCPIDYTQEGILEVNRYAHGANDWSQSPRLTVREVSMLALMNALTDKPNWHKKVHDEKIVEKWHKEALGMPLISETAWQWCLAELRDKAASFEKTGFVHVFDAGCGCIKSDTLINEDLRAELVRGIQPLLDIPAKEKDWHPHSDEQVLNLVHPSLFPCVYGKTRVLQTGGKVDLDDILGSCGKGDVAIVDDKSREVSPLFSAKFQWLPCEVAFQADGKNVKITSYINNLHPKHHEGLYRTVEKLISIAIEPWNQVLVYPMEGKKKPRIPCISGYCFEPDLPDWARDEQKRSLYVDSEDMPPEKHEELLKKVEEYMELPNNPDYKSDDPDEDEDEISDDEPGIWEKYESGTWDRKKDLIGAMMWKWHHIRKQGHPEPGEDETYEDWARFGKKTRDENLAETYREQGLQVIVKLSSIELTPDKPEYKGGNWHIEGMLNEHIVATAIYYYDVSNTTTSHVRFRQEAELDSMEMSYEQDEHEPLATVFGCDSLRDEPAVQELGGIATPQGRLLVFPNTLQHRVDPFHLGYPTQPGHRRFIVLWLVDPHYRILSTRNVPPQRHDWWAPEVYPEAGFEHRLPLELANMVDENIGEWPMGMDEAKELRLELMEERTKLMPHVEAHFEEYNFCEH